MPRGSTLTSELALLTIDPESGRLRGAIGYGLAAAALLDLTLLARIALVGRTVVVTDERPTGDPVLDEALCRIIEESRSRSAAEWVRALGRRRDIRERMIRMLEAKRLIQRLEQPIIRMLPAEHYSIVSPRVRPYLVGRVRATLMDGYGDAGERDKAMAIVLASLGMLDRYFARDERDVAHLRVASLMRASGALSTIASALREVGVGATADLKRLGAPLAPASPY